MAFFNRFLKYETAQLLFIQKHFEFLEPFLVCFTSFFRTQNICRIILPVVTFGNLNYFVDGILTVLIGDLLALLLKWIFLADRPYWWIHETQEYNKDVTPALKQFKQTCETSGGFPSSHSLVSTVVLLVSRKYIKKYLEDREMNQRKTIILVDISTGVLIILNWISRMYYGCHFFYQCAIGSLIGFYLVENFNYSNVRNKIMNMTQYEACLYWLACLASPICVYFGVSFFGIDLKETLIKAKTWCMNPDFVKDYTTPVYGTVEALGSLYGIALSAPLSKIVGKKIKQRIHFPLSLLTVIAFHLLDKIPVINYGNGIFYSFLFLKSALFMFTTLYVLPKICTDKESTN